MDTFKGNLASLHPVLPKLLFALIFATFATAAQAGARADFVAAEAALQSGDMASFRSLKHKLADYPLLPYLDYSELSRRLHGASADEVKAFLRQHADTPLAGRLRNRWLDQLAQRKQWQTYLDFFRPTKYTERRCQYLHALIATGHEQLAFGQVENLWLSGRSQPAACDPVFAAWRGAGRLSETLVWQRVQLAIESGQTRLARYLKRFLPAADAGWVELWVETRTNPGVIRDSRRFAAAHPQRENILLYGLSRLARSDAETTEQVWTAMRERYGFDQHRQDQGNRIVALAFLRHEHPDALAQLARLEPGDDRKLHDQRILAALSREDWQQALSWIDALPGGEAEAEERWRYWKARALQQLGRKQEALDAYKKIVNDRTYYAFLAADRIGAEYFLQHIPLHLEPNRIAAVEARPAARRAHELRALERIHDARREWRWLTRHMQAEELKAAALVAKNWQWHDQAIFTLARSGYWDDLELRFPLEYLELAEENAQEQGIELPWVLAVMRQESAFAADAVSRVGARGLMQLMPATARQTAKRLGQSAPGKQSLLQPATNIPLGTAYLSQVYDRLDRHPVLATAAYNAGPHRVERWLPERTQDADLWVESIPFKETRNYVKRVMAYAVIYEKRLGRQPGSIVERMRPVTGTEERAAKHPAGPVGDASS